MPKINRSHGKRRVWLWHADTEPSIRMSAWHQKDCCMETSPPRGHLPLSSRPVASSQPPPPADPGALWVPFKPSLKLYHHPGFTDGSTEPSEPTVTCRGINIESNSGFPGLTILSLWYTPSSYKGPSYSKRNGKDLSSLFAQLFTLLSSMGMGFPQTLGTIYPLLIGDHSLGTPII